MEFKIIWSPQAIDDLEGLIRFICRDDPLAAERLGFKIVDRINTLSLQPSLGPVVMRQAGSSIRRLLVVPFQIFYRPSPRLRMIEILKIWHSARGRSPL